LIQPRHKLVLASVKAVSEYQPSYFVVSINRVLNKP
jgi:hypothetical protein